MALLGTEKKKLLEDKTIGLLPGKVEDQATGLNLFLNMLLFLVIVPVFVPTLLLYHFVAWLLGIENASCWNNNPIENCLRKIVGIMSGLLLFCAYRELYLWISGMF